MYWWLYGPAAFSDGVTCADSSKYKHLWVLSLVFQLTMVTVVYIAVILLQIRGNCSPFNIIITYVQLGINAVMIAWRKFGVFCLHLFSRCIKRRFFHFVIPPLCISTSMKSNNTLLLDYVIAVYPIVLTVFIYVSTALHDRNCRIIVCLVSSLKWLWPRNWNPKETILNTCATFLLLSYSKFLLCH